MNKEYTIAICRLCHSDLLQDMYERIDTECYVFYSF
jgi:hypothetical protein